MNEQETKDIFVAKFSDGHFDISEYDWWLHTTPGIIDYTSVTVPVYATKAQVIEAGRFFLDKLYLRRREEQEDE